MTEETPREPESSEQTAQQLVEGLEKLMEGEGIVSALVHLGTPSVEPLRRFLLDGRPSIVYQPRRWAVRALGGLRADEVLMEYLNQASRTRDPGIAFAEQAVANAAVEELATHPDARVVRFLLGISTKRILPSLAAAFGELGLIEALPFLDRALEDDVCRPAAEEAFRRIGNRARAHLVASATTRTCAGPLERPSSLLRRRSALRLLGEIGISKGDYVGLRALIEDEDVEILVALSVTALNAGIIEDERILVTRLVEMCGEAPWYLRDDIRRCLVEWFEVSEAILEAELRGRIGTRSREIAPDSRVLFLSRILKAGQDLRRAKTLKETR